MPFDKNGLLYLLRQKTDSQPIYIEGKPFQIIITKYERDLLARKKCLEHYGFNWIICDFNFEKSYGVLAKDFIHVHHLTKISSIGKSYIIDPIKDLRPVCPNCHSIIHKRKTPYTIEEMIELIKIR